MFGKLKDKLKSWAKKISESAEKEEETPLQERSGQSTSSQKKDKTGTKEKNSKKEKPKKEIELPTKFNVGLKKFEPDLEKIEETIEELEEKSSQQNAGFFRQLKTSPSKIKITDKNFQPYEEELENLLLENNVAYEVTEKIIKELKNKIINQELLKKEVEEEIKDDFKEIIREILISPPNLIEQIKEKNQDQSKEPFVILFCGINGTGKTTTIAKIADNLKNNGVSCVIAAGDTFRAASIEQIKEHGEKIGVKVISHEYGADPASVGFDAIQFAKKNFINCVLIDTAGRMHTEKNLLKEIEKISRVCKPDLKLFIGESITGNDAVEQVKSFDWAIGIDGIILTKADIDEKGGTSLSLGFVTKKPIYYLGTGQAYDKIEPFDKEKFIERLGL